MFRESLLEECTDRGSRRRWATLTSFLLQMAAAAVCVVLPFLYPDALPLVHASSSLLMPPPSGGPPRPPNTSHAQDARPPIAQPIEDARIRVPREIPAHVDTGPDVAPVDPGTGPYVPGAIPSDNRAQSTLMVQLLQPPSLHPTLKKQSVTATRVSQGVSQGLLIAKIEPHYPPIAVRAHIEGDVVLAAIIGRDGRIENLHVIEGHPLLAQAALDAVKQWRYRPYMLGSEAVEVETQVTVRFRLNGGQ